MKKKFFILNILGLLTIFVKYSLTITLTRAIGLEAFGYYQKILNYGNLVGIIIAGGMGLFAVQVYSKNAISNLNLEMQIVNIYTITMGLFSIFIFIVVGLFPSILTNSIFICVAVGSTYALNNVVTRSLQGKRYQILSDLLRDTLIPIALIITLSIGLEDVTSYVILRCLFLSVAAYIGLTFITFDLKSLMHLRYGKFFKELRSVYREYVKILSSNISLNLLRLLSSKIDLLLAPFLLEPIEYGAYAYIRIIFTILGLPYTVVNKLYIPEVKLLKSGLKSSELTQKFIKLNSVTFVFQVLLGIFLFCSFTSINSFFGISIDYNYSFSIFLIIAYLTETWFGQNIALLTFTNNRKLAIRGTVLSLLVGALMLFTLGVYFGMIGIALSVLLGNLTKNVILEKSCLDTLKYSPAINFRSWKLTK